MRTLPILCGLLLASSPAVSAGVLDDWTDAASASAVAAKQGAAVQSRAMAMVHLAMFEAINGSDGPYGPYLAPGAASVPAAGTGAAAAPEREVAAAAAAHAVLAALYPDQKTALDAALAKSLAGAPDSPARTAAVEEGKRLAAAVTALRASDGAAAPNTVRPLTRPGMYIPTALPIAFAWCELKPWFLKSPAQFRPPPPPALSSALWARDYEEIRTLGGKTGSRRTEAQTETAKFWQVTGPLSWTPIVRELANRPGRSLVQNARLYALVSLAAADTYVAVFDAKYKYNFWRPVTAIRNGDEDGNDATTREAAWEPLIETPMHPEYPCAHCINSGAVAAVLESEFGAGPIGTFHMTTGALPGVTHAWDKLSDYAAEVSNARIWSGVHYRNSVVVGAAMGRQIGALAVATLLRPR